MRLKRRKKIAKSFGTFGTSKNTNFVSERCIATLLVKILRVPMSNPFLTERLTTVMYYNEVNRTYEPPVEAELWANSVVDPFRGIHFHLSQVSL